ncbi:pectin lyase fold/virulence factor [Mycena sp. CBHHK59/15]|nr:pectin lyase fold/virulence factor [Mycena sp. CBHHK59/15]
MKVGFGAQSTGGRGGSVYVVTNLNDTGTGSLRDAVSQPNRVVVFSVGGLITISDRIVVSRNIYIAGQTAPGQGITVYGNGLSYSNANNTITRDAGKDAITIAEGANMIFDHVSVSWGRDETFSINGEVFNVTISDCIIAQGLETHSAGGLIQTDGGVSIIRSLYIDNQTRNPKVKGVNEFINNVRTLHNNITRGNANFHTYVSDNLYDPDQVCTIPTVAGIHLTQTGQDVQWLHTCRNNWRKISVPDCCYLAQPTDVLARINASAGASLSRDHVDAYLINTELGSLGKVGALITDPTLVPINGPGPIAGGTAPIDSDGDGIPDAYEVAHGLNPNVNDAANIASNGYANIENYVNSLV